MGSPWHNAQPSCITLAAGFVEEMRFVAMKLHTKDQAPKEGGKEAAKQPFQQVRQSMCGDQLHAFAGGLLDMHDSRLQLDLVKVLADLNQSIASCQLECL